MSAKDDKEVWADAENGDNGEDNGDELDKGGWNTVRYKRSKEEVDVGVEQEEEAKVDGRKQWGYKQKQGDWRCNYCDNVNFAWRPFCNDCRREFEGDLGENFVKLWI